MGGTLTKRVFPFPEPPTYTPKNARRLPRSVADVRLSALAPALNVFWVNTAAQNGTEGHGYDIACCFIAAEGDSPWHCDQRPCIILSHENAEDIGGTYRYASEIARICAVNIIIYDYPGYGLSSGSPSESGCYAAILAVHGYVQTLGYQHIILMGKSLGSGPTIWLASQRRVAGVLVQSGFASIYNVYLQRTTPIPSMGDIFLNTEKVGYVLDPIMFVHGEADDLISCEQAKHLALLSNHSVNIYLVPQAKHNDVEKIAGRTYYINIQRFFVYTWALSNPKWLYSALTSSTLTKLETIRQEEIFLKKRWPKLVGLPKIISKEKLTSLAQDVSSTVDSDAQQIARALIIAACFIKANIVDRLLNRFYGHLAKNEIKQLLQLLMLKTTTDAYDVMVSRSRKSSNNGYQVPNVQYRPTTTRGSFSRTPFHESPIQAPLEDILPSPPSAVHFHSFMNNPQVPPPANRFGFSNLHKLPPSKNPTSSKKPHPVVTTAPAKLVESSLTHRPSVPTPPTTDPMKMATTRPITVTDMQRASPMDQPTRSYSYTRGTSRPFVSTVGTNYTPISNPPPPLPLMSKGLTFDAFKGRAVSFVRNG